MSLTPRPVPPDAPRVVIVDADRRVQQSLSDLLGLTGQVSVVGRAGDVRAALQEVERASPDIEAGVALIAGMSRAWPSLRIVLTGWNDTHGHARLDGTPTSYVSKGGSPEEFVTAIVEACCPV
jgi:DNA-binding NarL/FixJ family response regulator